MTAESEKRFCIVYTGARQDSTSKASRHGEQDGLILQEHESVASRRVEPQQSDILSLLAVEEHRA